MAKRIILISSFPLLVAIAIIAIVLAGIGHGQPASPPAPIDSARATIISLADAGKLAEMDAAVNKLTTDYTDTAILTKNYYIIADSFAWRRMNDRANRLYQLVIDKSADSSLIVKARLGLARVEILGLIEEKKFSIAQEKLDSIIADFNDEPALPMALFHIGKEFSWQHRYSEAIDAFDNTANKSSDTSLSQQAKLWSARSSVCSLIGKAKDTEVIAATDKLMSDFAGDAGLADAVYWISKEYEWKKGTSINRAGWYDTPNSVYQKIMQQFSDTPYGQQAEWDQKRLAHRMNIFKLMKEPNQAATDAAIETMAIDLKGRPELAGELYWIACGYEEHPNKMPQAEKIYERIVKDCPGTDEADRASLDLQRRIICDLFDTGDANTATALLDKFIANFSQNPYSGTCLGRAVIGFYFAGAKFRDNNQSEKSKQYYQIAADIWQKLPKDTLQKGMETTYLYFYIAINYHELGRWADAIANYQKVLDDQPDFEYACGIQAAIGGCYEKLRDEESVPKEQVNPLIEETYKTALANSSVCYSTPEIAYKLAGMMLEKGDKASAAKYYNKFLETAKRKDDRIATVKAKLAELAAEGGNN
jgi:tetratricopeptide (TPR) repeat protein